MAYFDCIVGGSGKGNTLVVTCADDLAGATITCTNGTKTYTKTCPSTAPYEVTFYGLAAGTWTVSATVSGSTYTATVVITDYEAELGGFSWRAWVDLSKNYASSDFTDLDDLLSDETAIRELMTIHACVDYLAGITTTNADVETIIGNDLCAKWINNRDYALDTLYANTVIKGYMDTADKYGYGEWCLMPQVPKMTSDTTPSGVASATSVYSSSDAYKAYRAFRGTWDGTGGSGNCWQSEEGYITNQRIAYRFTTPVCVKAFEIMNTPASESAPKTVKLQGSNDGTNWEDISEVITCDTTASKRTRYAVENDVSYLYIGLMCLTNNGGRVVININTLQFYAWAPKGNVPVMTSNTAPYGEAIGNGASNGEAYRAFDGNEATSFADSTYGTSGGQRLAYKFTNPVNVKKLHHTSAAGATDTIKVQYSDDGTTWTDTGDTFTNTQSVSGGKDVDVTDSGYHLYWGIYCTGSTITSRMSTTTLQFYGRELSVSNPAMTGFTTPYGTVTESRHFESTQYGNHPGWQAFDKSGKGWQIAYTQTATTSDYLQYVFNDSFNISFIRIYQNKRIGGETVYSLMGIKDDDTLELIQDITQTMIDEYKIVLVADKLYKGIKIVPKSFTSYNQIHFYEIEIFGKDYSEKEFEEGTTKKWLYDHGVELETIDTVGTVTKGSDYLTISSNNSYAYANNVNLAPFSLLRGKVGSHASGTNQLVVWSGVASSNFTETNMPNNNVIDVSSINTINQVGFLQSASGILDATELWLE